MAYANRARQHVKIDIWSDVVCPFCFIGKRHLELALADFEHRDQVEIAWHSFELDPNAPAELSERLVEHIAHKYQLSREQSVASQQDIAARAAAVGLSFDWQNARPGNTFDAHRVIHFAASHGVANQAEDVLMTAYFSQGKALGKRETLIALAPQIGLDPDEVREMLASDRFADAVRADEAQAQAYGITGVPFFVVNDKYGISGAQPVEAFQQALTQIWSED